MDVPTITKFIKTHKDKLAPAERDILVNIILGIRDGKSPSHKQRKIYEDIIERVDSRVVNISESVFDAKDKSAKIQEFYDNYQKFGYLTRKQINLIESINEIIS